MVSDYKLQCTLKFLTTRTIIFNVKNKEKKKKKGLRYFMNYSLLANLYLEICYHNRQCNYKEPSSSMSSSPSIIWRLKVNKFCLFEKINYD